MIKELVAGSACICPPVEGWALLRALVVAPLKLALDPVLALLVLLEPKLPLDKLAVPLLPPPEAEPLLAANAARSVTASLLASAFFK